MIKSTGDLAESEYNEGQEKRICDLDRSDSATRRDCSNEISITVESLGNVIDNRIKEVAVLIEFMGNILTQSVQTPIVKRRADINCTTTFKVDEMCPAFMNEILSNPVFFTVLDCTVGRTLLEETPTVEAKKKVSKTSASPMSISKTYMSNSSVLGICNLDIGSLVTGTKTIKETLLVESEKKLTPLETTVWKKLPKLAVVVTTGSEPLISKSFHRYTNLLAITVESIYNVPEYIAEGSVFDACISLPTIGDKTNRVKFPNGITTSTRDFNCRKKWVNLAHLEGPGARTKLTIIPNACDVISGLPNEENIGNDLAKEQKTIRWDMWRNFLMLKTDVNYFYQKILKYRVWPIEIVLPSKSKELVHKEKSSKSDKKSKPAPSANVSQPADHFTAFLNLSPLLHPGVTRIRVAAPLLTYSQTDLVSKFGMEFSSLQLQGSVLTVKGKTGSERSKASIRDFEENKDGMTTGLPVFGEDGSPTYIIVEVELSKPLCQKRDPDILEENLKANLSIKGKMKKKKTNLDLMKGNFTQAVLDAVQFVSKEYQSYLKLDDDGKVHQPEDEINFFYFFCKGKNFLRIRDTLEDKIVELVSEKFGAVDPVEKKLPGIYTYLVNEMHRITNRFMVGEDFTFPRLNADELQLFAEEAIEEGDYDLAKEYLLLKLSKNTSNPNYWLDIAIYCIKLNDYMQAIEAVREALYLDFYHQIGLLLYALLMELVNNPSLAELTFEILLTKYPTFIEGWMVLRLFYMTYDNPEGATVAHQQARVLKKGKLCNETVPTSHSDFFLDTHQHDKYEPAREEKYGTGSFKNGISWTDSLSWTTSICPPKNDRLRTMILLQKLGFYQLASMCLSDELLSSEKEDRVSPAFVYYTCVNHYLKARYEDAVPVLQKYAQEYGKDCYIWSLLGHCYYKLENHESAISCYEYVIESYNRPDDIHLIYIRMGYYYLEAKKYPCARQIFKTATRFSSTPRLWKGLGIACLMMKNWDEAEIAFTEANYLNNADPETWAYLGITNAMLLRLDLFRQCCTEARKRDLNNRSLIRKIVTLAKAHGLEEEEFQF